MGDGDCGDDGRSQCLSEAHGDGEVGCVGLRMQLMKSCWW